MKRRLFLQGLLGASAVAPVIAKAITKPEVTKKLTRHEIEYGENAWFGLAKPMPEGGRTEKAVIAKDPWKEAFMPGVEKWYGDNWNK